MTHVVTLDTHLLPCCPVLKTLGIDSLLAEMTLGLGLAIIAGNGFAIWKHRRGEAPADAAGPFRAGRVAFLSVIGALMAIWGGISIFR